MDINIRIIEAVRNCPVLYQCRGITFMERKKTWRELAERLNIQGIASLLLDFYNNLKLFATN